MKKNKLDILFMSLGLLLVAAALTLSQYNFATENAADAASAESLQTLVTAVKESKWSQHKPEAGSAPVYMLAPDIEMPTIEVDGNDYIGYLYIPSLEVELPIMSEWSYPHLKIAPCRYVGSAYSNDLVIAAHNYKKHFGGIKNLNVGDTVVFTDVDNNVFNYKVALSEVLEPAAIEEMTSSGYDLTLFTCTIGGTSRVTVRCTRDYVPHVAVE